MWWFYNPVVTTSSLYNLTPEPAYTFLAMAVLDWPILLVSILVIITMNFQGMSLGNLCILDTLAMVCIPDTLAMVLLGLYNLWSMNPSMEG